VLIFYYHVFEIRSSDIHDQNYRLVSTSYC